MENGDGPLPTTWQEFELTFRNSGLLHHKNYCRRTIQCWQTTLVHPHVLLFLSWLSSCALTQHSVTAQRISHPASAPQMRVPATRGLAQPAQNSILQSGRLKLYGEIK